MINIAPYLESTNNVSLAISQAAIKFGVSKEKIGFNIQKVSTTIRNIKERKTQDALYLTKKDLINPYFTFKQNYSLIMRVKESQKNNFPNVTFANNKTHTTVYLIIKKNQDLKLSLFSRESFVSHLENILIKYKCLIRIDKNNSLNSLLDDMYNNYKMNEITTKDIEIKVLDFPDVVKPMPDSLEMVYAKQIENNEIEENLENKNNKNKVKIASVKEGSIVIKYRKVVDGTGGRTYEGRFLSVSAIKPRQVPNFSIDKTIKKEETNQYINYIAKETGFVFFENKFLRIDNKTEMFTATIRNKDKLMTSLDDGVSINIKSKDKFSDAVGSNLSIKSDKVNIEGNVGSSSTIEGNIVKIGGQTHSRSKIEGKKVYINTHKGKAQGVNVFIDTLEGGVVIANNVKIKMARGGLIEGENIVIDVLDSNVEIVASHTIKIGNITGESNVLTLKPIENLSIGDVEDSLESLIDKKEIIEILLKKQEKELKEKIILIEFNESSLNIQRDDKIDKVRYNIKSSKIMDNKMQSYVKLQDEKEKIEAKIINNQKELEDIDKKIENIYADTKNAYIEMQRMWSAGNSVHIHHSGKVYNFYPKEDMIESPISFESLRSKNLI
jgi:hypothetical protein